MSATTTATIVRTIGGGDTAAAFGNSGVDVLGTPRLVAWCEDAAAAVLRAHGVHPSLGTIVELHHLAGAKIGEVVRVRAELTSARGRRAEFEIEATAGDRVIGRCRHTRFVPEGVGALEQP
ncbi:thioesterase family protein [Microbacterium sp. BR1]|uniref:thioesterase family protein n=1 Tax=Microbacterium sp. BR1 TaxID=1070896 RepID=UPI0012FE5F22|nr:hotdog domain-containing protein [Microbacterium sp. BR1]